MASLLRSLLSKLIGPKRRGTATNRISPPPARCPTTVDQFATLIVNSRICSECEARGAAESFAAECLNSETTPSVESFCDFLISTNRLTAWQCGKLREGKWKGFHLDHYLLLGQAGKDSESSSYDARYIRDGRYVLLSITPRNRTNRQIVYREYPYL